jgi:hypothetical protein
MTWESFLAEPHAERCWLLEIDALILTGSDPTLASASFSDDAFSEMAFSEAEGSSTSSVATLLYSSHGFISAAADTPARTWYDGRIANVQLARQIFGRSGVGGMTRTSGEITLVNSDGALDTLLSDYAIDGRAAKLLLGRPNEARSNYGTVFTGVVRSAIVGAEFRLAVSDGLDRIEDVPVVATTYAGTGGLEGGSDLKGKHKPKVYGEVFNISPPLVDSVKLIYQLSDGAINAVPAVYDRGIALTNGGDYASQSELESVSPSAGQYRVYKAGGYFRLGATPAGLCTADVQGDASPTYINTTSDIVARLLSIAAIDSTGLDLTSFSRLTVDAPGAVGIWIWGGSVRDAVEQLLAGIGAYGGFSRTGLVSVGVIKAADAATPSEYIEDGYIADGYYESFTDSISDSYTETEIGEIEREPLPSVVEPAIWRANVAWQHNYTVQTDLASGVTAERRVFADKADRIAESTDLTVKSRRLWAPEYGPTGNLYATQAAADTEALRLRNLWNETRALFRVPLPPVAMSRDIGDVVTITHSRHGVSAGRDVRVLGKEINDMRVTLLVLA